ncbi:MAG: glycerate kinase [Thermoplasmata archaeon]
MVSDRTADPSSSAVSDAIAIVCAGIRAVDPGVVVRKSLRRSHGALLVGQRTLREVRGGRVHVVAIGKAAGGMADAAWQVARGRVEGLAVVPRGYPAPRAGAEVVIGDHPLPGRGSFRAGRRALEYVAETSEEDVTLFLLSGGGSAALELPPVDISLPDLVRTNQLLLGCGAPIAAMNTIRRHLSEVKGGRLAVAVRSKRFATVAISDVEGDRPCEIASGPTVGDPTTFRDALRVVRRYALTTRLPRPVLHHLVEGARGGLAETPKPGDPHFRGRPFVLAASNRTALIAASVEARRRRYLPRILSSRVTGETRLAGAEFGRKVGLFSTRNARVAVLSGGETTVTLGRRPGRGGRNQEFALAAAQALQGTDAVVLSAGTDGIDGPTDAAGGWVDGRSVERARREGVAIRIALREHASYDALIRVGGLWKPGPTGTNVMDLHVGLVPGRTASPLNRGTAGSSPRYAAPSSRRRRS